MPDCPNNVMAPEKYCAPHWYAVNHVKNSEQKQMKNKLQIPRNIDLATADGGTDTSHMEYWGDKGATPAGEDISLIEQLAAIEHERWADWQKWCHKVLRENNPSPEQGDILERWDRQIETPYAELSEKEKQSDRDQVARYLPLIQAHYESLVAEAYPTLAQVTEMPTSTEEWHRQVKMLDIYKANIINKFKGIEK